MGRGQAFAARIRRERALQIKADLNLGGGGGGRKAHVDSNGVSNGSGIGGSGNGPGGAKAAPDGDASLRGLVHATLAKFVGFFIVQERLSRALPSVLALDSSLALCSQACHEVGSFARSAIDRAKAPAVLLAMYDALLLACGALRRRGFDPTGLEAAAAAAAGRYVDLLGAAVSAGIAPGSTLERLYPVVGEAHSVVAGEIADMVGAFAADAGAFIGQLRAGAIAGAAAGGCAGVPGGAAAEAAAKVRGCVEELARECVQPMAGLFTCVCTS